MSTIIFSQDIPLSRIFFFLTDKSCRELWRTTQ